ncbi:UNVERIFIED_CONTAM: Retrovirus-related Pol polyprotein from transposon RE2 [Sesamum radiatum]|uniref:Retrovirus-related Pol polyprotein from transposon RE2 n=1 Tax=Sesamum radiatum TaxID=300843 RepID=A0AAW2WHZ3_SESRA
MMTNQENRQNLPETLQLRGSDHPGMVLVSAHLTSNNYLNWNFGVKRALCAKLKLNFIDNTSVKPSIDHPHFEQWIRVDNMITTWILNSISKDIVKAFMYVKTSRNLWLDIEQCYVMDPIPSINKAYSMVQSVEKQKQVHMELSEATKNTALHVKDGLQYNKKSSPEWYKDLVDKRKKDTGPPRVLQLKQEHRNSRWAFKLKLNLDSSIQRYKARLVANGYNQIEGVDYFDNFSLVAKSITVRIFLAFAVSQSWPLLQLDINNAFLHGKLDEDVYMDLPEGFIGAQSRQVFTIKDIGQEKYFLGLDLTCSSDGIHVTQHKYLQDILVDTSMLVAKPAPTPFPSSLKLVLEEGSILSDPSRYNRLISCLLYLGFTRPDISFVVQQLSQFLQAPCTSHWNDALHVLRYLKDTPCTGFCFFFQLTQCAAYSDVSWASCLDS